MIDLQEILLLGQREGASDIHLTGGVMPRMRVRGKLLTMNCGKLQQADILEIVLTVMKEQQREEFDERGEYELTYSMPKAGRYRISAYRERGAVSLVFRQIFNTLPEPQKLGIPETVMAMGALREGLVLFAGGMASGRSTTMAAVTDGINRTRAVHVITLEDPIEYVHHHALAIVSQREIGSDTHSFSGALKAALKEDADVISVERLEDQDTIRQAMAAATAGCLVLAGTYASGTADAVDSLLELFSAEEQERVRMRLADVLEAVVFQKMVLREGETEPAPVFEVLRADAAVKEKIRQGKVREI